MTADRIITKCIYVDLSNLYGGIAELFSAGIYIDFSTLMPILDEIFDGIDQYKVYGAYMGYDENMPIYKKEFIKAQNEFFNSAKLANVHFGQGRISKFNQEKGVDMQLGVDMVNDAHNSSYTDYILFSGDADFDYPIEIIKSLGKNFHYCGFANRFAKSFSYKAWKKAVIDYNGYFIKTTAPKTKLPKKLIIKDIYKDSTIKIKSVSLI